MTTNTLIFSALIVLLAGVGLPIQANLNAQLGKTIGQPLVASFISFLVGAVFMLGCALVTRASFPTITALRNVTVPQWMAGALGAFYVTTAIFLTPKLGTSLTFALVISGQLLVSLIIDHFGLLGVSPHAINVWRIAGVLLLFAGVIVIQKS